MTEENKVASGIEEIKVQAKCEIPIKNSWLIKFKDGYNAKSFKWPKCVNVQHDFAASNAIHIDCPLHDLYQIEEQLDGIEVIEPDAEYKPTCLETRQIITDNQYLVQNTQTTGAFIERIGAHKSSQKSGDSAGLDPLSGRANINVFVVDTGIYPHDDLNVVGGRDFTTSNPDDWTDRYGHGTHVAGIIGAKDNDFGIVGVAPGVRLWAVKVLSDAGGGTLAGIVAGLNWIAETRDQLWTGYGIVNMSLSGPASSVLDGAINDLINQGIIVVVAAGNDSTNASIFSPARTPNAVTVGATGPNPAYNTLANYSNYGTIVDILAPGSSITSTYRGGGYATMSGTSMACPVVAGTFALQLSTQSIVDAGKRTARFVDNARIHLILTSMNYATAKYYDGTKAFNDRIQRNVECTNVSVWAGMY